MTASRATREQPGGDLSDRSSVRLWLRLLSCTMVIEKMIQRRLAAEFGTTLPRFDLLAALDRNRDGMTMGALSAALLVSNGNVTGIVRKLAAEGLVTATPLPSDRRSSLVRMTEPGARHFAQLAKAHRDWVDGLLADLPAAQRESLYEGLGELKSALGKPSGRGAR